MSEFTDWQLTCFTSSCRYKMISEFTWPNHDLPSDKAAVTRLLQGCGFDHDVAYGKTKVFIRTPRTLFSLEEQRAEMVQRIVLFLQKVRISPLQVALGPDSFSPSAQSCGTNPWCHLIKLCRLTLGLIRDPLPPEGRSLLLSLGRIPPPSSRISVL